MRLIALISPANFLINMIHPKSPKIFSADFLMACREKMFIFGIFKLYISNFVYYNLYQRIMKAITRKKYAIHFLIRPLHISLEIREDPIHLHGSPKKNLDALSKNQ